MDKMRPFPNGTSMCIFHENNCYRCKKYDYNPDKTCDLDLAIGLAYFDSGEINTDIAKRIGWDGEGYINYECNEREQP